MTEITNFGTSLWVSFSQAVGSLLRFLPALLGALVILVVGWLIAKAVCSIVRRGLEMIGLERASAHAGLGNFIARTGSRLTASRLVAELARWFVFLIFVQAAATVLGFPQLIAVINSIVLFLPKLVVAGLILIGGALLANFAAGLVRGSVSTMKVGSAEVFANFIRIAVIAFAFIAALSHLGIAPVVVNTLFIGLVAGVALAVGLSFGLGGREAAAELTQRWIGRASAAAKPELRDSSHGRDKAA